MKPTIIFEQKVTSDQVLIKKYVSYYTKIYLIWK